MTTNAAGAAQHSVDVETFRAEAREWLAANMQRRATLPAASGQHTFEIVSVEGVVAERALQSKVYEGGFAGITFPVEYGGRGLSRAHEKAFLEESRAYRMPDYGIAYGATFVVCAETMLAHASPDFLHRHIPKMLAGEEIWVQFFSEPDAGSDLAGVRSRAVRAGDRWVLNGAKIWTSGAYLADYGLCLARTNWDVPKHRGLTWFAVRTDAPGVTVSQITQIDGTADFCQEFFDDVELTDDDVIGEVDQGWTVAQTMLVFERGFGSERAQLSARELAPDLVSLARRVGRLGDPLTRQLIARAHINDFAVSQLGRRIASQMRAGLNAGVAAYGKLASGSFDPVRARISMQIGGPESVVWGAKAADAVKTADDFLNARKMAIAGGTNEVQRNGIGERVLGLPREPSFDTRKPFNDVIRDARNWSGKVG